MKNKLKKILKPIVENVAVRLSPKHWKDFNELLYWKTRRKIEGTLANSHYKYFYTTHFGLFTCTAGRATRTRCSRKNHWKMQNRQVN